MPRFCNKVCVVSDLCAISLPTAAKSNGGRDYRSFSREFFMEFPFAEPYIEINLAELTPGTRAGDCLRRN